MAFILWVAKYYLIASVVKITWHWIIKGIPLMKILKAYNKDMIHYKVDK